VSAQPSFRVAFNPPWHELPRVSAVVASGRAGDYHVDDYATTFSLKSVARGRADYRTARSRYLLEPDRFVLLNHGQRYGMDIDARDGTETLCLFFEPGFLEEVARARRTPAARLLDGEGGAGGPSFGVIERLHLKTGALAAELAALAAVTPRSAGHDGGYPQTLGGWLEDRLYACAAEIVRFDDLTRREMESLPALRPSTRAELYRRLHHARDFLESCFAEPLTVASVARVACMSPYHFQRMFKEAWGVTPMAYLQARRLAVARRLLAETSAEVTQVALAVGFESPGSFSALFRRRAGVTPTEYRRRARPNSQD
jgi:AraC family transcriptional regulator